MVFKSLALTATVALLIAVMVLAIRPTYEGTRAGRADEDYLGSKTCLHCHTDHYASWARTYHSRMTQEARPLSVQGDFERDNTFDYLGIRARMEKLDGAFSMTLTLPDGRRQVYSIDRTVGSRRIEQYLTKQNGQYVRLPVAFDLVNRRWMNLNGSFFYPDGENYFQHQSQWDPNCVFCHNVKAQPNFDAASRTFNTEVSELGVACGACHGQAARHAEEAASPLVRTLWRISNEESKQIVNPSKLTPDRSMMVCGHCHGQRVPEPISRIQTILGHGDPYNSGDDLSNYYRPVTRETTVGSYAFANRFWPNGSPRLTAYEYQGILRSRCFVEGDPSKRINCLSCHTMHGGDPKGQITEENRSNKPCLVCHEEYEAPAALARHTKHGAESAGSSCYTCHTPRVVYGVMAIHPTHDITIPSPQLTAAGIPNACNQCHLDRSVNWAINESKRLWPERYRSASLINDAQYDLPEGPRSLFAGDALARALAAEAMGGGGPAKPDPQWAGPYLVEAFNDNYPVVRFFAANALASGPWKYPKPDYLGTPEVRLASLNQWRMLFDPSAQQNVSALAAQLRAKRRDVDIEVGE
ncbi:MAG TPA: cytochrome c3 family protein [Blastocatellia bacterium]|nr:cytochrome c3 family protein [Blastocatellia bacterium]